jgi:tRNA (cytidine/uridine-2'-O-)-methyltransferase
MIGVLHVVLVEPEIPWNTGNAGRTCLAFGAQLHLVGPLGFDLDEKKVRRAGVDYWKAVQPRVYADWASFEALLPELGQPLFLTAEAPRELNDVVLADFDVLVLGRESTGLPAEIRTRYQDRTARIPMTGTGVRSLNLSTAVGIALYARTAGQST